jgi:hypothetical protein
MGEGVRIYENDDKWPEGITGTSFGTTTTILGYDTGVDTLGAYGTDYILLTKLKWQYFSKLHFDGLTDILYHPMWVQEDVNGDGDLEWFTSDPGPYSDISIVAEVDLAGETTATLMFDSYWEIELDWDFGFVQVSNDNGETWISLENAYTTEFHNPNAMPEIVANLPGISGNASEAIVNMEFNLAEEFLVDDLLIRFRYMTDPMVQEYGWWIDNAQVRLGEEGPVINGNTEYITLTNFGPAWDLVKYYVHVIRVDYWKGKSYYTYIREMTLDENNEGSMFLSPFTFKFPGFRCRKSPDVLLVVSATHSFTDYEFSVSRMCMWKPWMWCGIH